MPEIILYCKKANIQSACNKMENRIISLVYNFHEG